MTHPGQGRGWTREDGSANLQGGAECALKGAVNGFEPPVVPRHKSVSSHLAVLGQLPSPAFFQCHSSTGFSVLGVWCCMGGG